MGCACVKSDSVIKNQKITSINSDNSINKRERNSPSVLRQGSNSNQNVVNNSHAIPDNPRNSSVNPRGSSQIRGNSSSNVNRPSHTGNQHTRHIQHNSQISGLSSYNITGAMPYLPSNNDPDFNFPEIPDVYIGTGLKRMKAYISPVGEEDLEKKRLAFWGTRVEGTKETWEFLQIICSSKEIEEDFIKEYLNAAGVSPCSNCINLTYDSRGYYYEIPNYCINEPYKFEIEDKKTKHKPQEREVECIVRKVVQEKKYKLLNTQTIADLKHMIAQNFEEAPIEEERIRLFFCGKELINDHELWTYNIEDESIVMLMLKAFD